ncbi:hypothetical protein JHE00_25260 [Prauserella sp. ASG 168]|uniref:Intracellular septation protein A n=2 Tax=Prauserella cavernicola TaxID=2800127 RepID=A0A934QYJ6_9PSEU|nr:hypothetical protein [Prauserella cavernicola]
MLLFDLVVPIVGFYVLRALGVEPVLALILAGVPTIVHFGYRAIAKRKLDALGIFVLVVLAGSVALSFVTGSARFLLAREGWFTGVIGIGFLATLWTARPLAFRMARGMLEHSTLAATLRPDTWDARWEGSARFRRTWRVATVLWGVGLLADAVARVVMAYTLPTDTVPALGGVLWAVTFVLLQVVQHLYFTKVGLWRSLREDPEFAAGGLPATRSGGAHS